MEFNSAAFGFIIGMLFMGILLSTMPSSAEVNRAVKAGCGQYNSQTGAFEYYKKD